jgi:hypothetical protein
MDNVIRICAESLGAKTAPLRAKRNTEEQWKVTDYITSEVYAESVRLPFLDVARILIEKGYDPGMTLMLVDKMTGMPRVQQQLGDAAKMTVIERDDPKGSIEPRFAPYRPYPS